MYDFLFHTQTWTALIFFSSPVISWWFPAGREFFVFFFSFIAWSDVETSSSHWSSGAHHHVIWNKSWGHRLFLRRVIQSYTSSSRQFLELFFLSFSFSCSGFHCVNRFLSWQHISSSSSSTRSTISEKSIELLKTKNITMKSVKSVLGLFVTQIHKTLFLFFFSLFLLRLQFPSPSHTDSSSQHHYLMLLLLLAIEMTKCCFPLGGMEGNLWNCATD